MLQRVLEGSNPLLSAINRTVRKYRPLFFCKGFEPRRNGCGAGKAAEPSEKGTVYLFPRWKPGGSCSPPLIGRYVSTVLCFMQGIRTRNGSERRAWGESRSDGKTVRGTVLTFLQRSEATARKSLALRFFIIFRFLAFYFLVNFFRFLKFFKFFNVSLCENISQMLTFQYKAI